MGDWSSDACFPELAKAVGIGPRSPRSCRPTSLPDLKRELVRRNEKRILLQYLSDYHARVGIHDASVNAVQTCRQLIGADDRVVVLGKHVIEACLVFH